MKHVHIAMIVILISAAIIAPVYALEAITTQSNGPIEMSVQYGEIKIENCDLKETFLVNGTLSIPITNSPVQIKIYNPNGTIYDSERIPPQQISSDGKYWYSFDIIYGNTTPDGPYKVEASYNGYGVTTSVHLVIPPIIRGPVPNTLRIVDNNGNNLHEVRAGQQVQIEDSVQPPMCGSYSEFAYIIQVQDQKGETASLSWIEGAFVKNQPMNFSETWTPFFPGNYTVQRYLWQSIDNPNALEPSVSKTVEVI
ncbi:MAG: hypothetical protein KGH88_06670 [Thaumarchaeota archaeon]|nr:hypothetical protein [Nitrososphaerota archaeon]